MSKINPFQPFKIISPGMFAGRANELERLETQLIQTRGENPCCFLIKGERGIGKSSLLLYVQWLAEGKVNYSEEEFHFLVVSISVDKNTSQLDLIRSIQLNIEIQLNKDDPARELLSKAWEFLQRVEVSGSSIRGESKAFSAAELTERFVYGLAETTSKLCSAENGNPLDGILILVDEADNANPDLDLGSFLKNSTERLQKLGINKVVFGLAGLDNLPDVLTKSHPSSLRMFDVMHLERLSEDEIGQVIDLALEDSYKKNTIKTNITEEGKKGLILLSEGFPHFIQQFGYSAFALDDDDVIDNNDVQQAAYEAWERIGDQYYRGHFERIRKESYRQVLRIMAENLDAWVTKKAIKKEFVGATSTLNNAIAVLRKLGIIIPKPDEVGVYKLQHKAFAAWIKLYAPKAE